MSKSKLLEEAIADAKSVRETALENAKVALQETFTPKLQSMISAKLQQEMDGDDEYEEEMEDDSMEVDYEDEAEVEDEVDVDMEDEVEVDDEVEETYNEEDDMEDEEDLDLESIIKELELDEEEVNEQEVNEEEDEDESEEEVDEDIDIQEIVDGLREEEELEESEWSEEWNGDGTPTEGPAVDTLQAELKEAYKTIEIMQSSLQETNLLNAKLLFSNKLFKSYDLNESQKLTVIDQFDRATTLREVKLVFATISESFKLSNNKKRAKINESASRPTASTAPKKEILSEGDVLVKRWQKLAGLEKK